MRLLMILNIKSMVHERLITSDTQRMNISRMKGNVRLNITHKLVTSYGFVLSITHPLNLESYREILK